MTQKDEALEWSNAEYTAATILKVRHITSTFLKSFRLLVFHYDKIKCNFRKNAASGEEVVTNVTDTRKQKKALMLTTEKCRVVKHLADLL